MRGDNFFVRYTDDSRQPQQNREEERAVNARCPTILKKECF